MRQQQNQNILNWKSTLADVKTYGQLLAIKLALANCTMEVRNLFIHNLQKVTFMVYLTLDGSPARKMRDFGRSMKMLEKKRINKY